MGSRYFVLEHGGMEKQDSEGLGPKDMLYLDAEGLVRPGLSAAQPVRDKDCSHPPDGRLAAGPAGTELAAVRRGAEAEARDQLLRGNNRQCVLLREIILDGVKRFK